MAEDVVAGGTYRFELKARKDGDAWDLTGATVTLFLYDPVSNTTAARSASLSATRSDVAYYDGSTSDVAAAGDWERAWRVRQGTLDLTSRKIAFRVVDSLS